MGIFELKPFFAGKRKYVIIPIAIIILITLHFGSVGGINSVNTSKNVVRQQEAAKPDVAGVQAIQPTVTVILTEESTLTSDKRQQVTLVKVVDGDTIAVLINGKNETIRVIGIDKYQRLLRYVFIDGGSVDFGKMMIESGLAFEYTYNTSYKYQQAYKQAEKEAREAKKGLWADDACMGYAIQKNTAEA